MEAGILQSNAKKASPSGGAFSAVTDRGGLVLNVKRGAAPAGALDRWVIELEPGRFQGLDVIDDAAVEVHQRGGVDKDLQIVELEDLVHRARLVLKRHRILETGTTAAHYANA